MHDFDMHDRGSRKLLADIAAAPDTAPLTTKPYTHIDPYFVHPCEGRKGWWRVEDTSHNMVCECNIESDAVRIADALEELDRKEANRG